MGYGAGFYEPIARAIDGINKQININSQRADQRQAQGLQQLLLASQLQTAQENRGLNKRAAERADKTLQETINNNALIATSRTNADNIANAQEARAITNFEAEEGKRKEAEAQLKYQHDPVPVNFFDYFSNNPRVVGMAGNTPTKEALLHSLGGPEVIDFDLATGNFMNKTTGQPLMMSRFDFVNNHLPAMTAAMKIAAEPMGVNRGDKQQLEGEIADIKSQIKTNTPSSKGMDLYLKQNAELKIELEKKKKRLERRKNLTIDDKIDMYVQQREQILDNYIKAKKAGLRPELEQYFIYSLNQNNVMQERLHKEKLKKMANANALAAKKAGGKPAVTLKDLRISYEKIRDIGYNAIKQLNHMIPDFNTHKERIEKAAFDQKLVIAKQYFARGGDLADLGLTKEQVFPEEKEVKLVPDKKDLKPKASTKKYKTKEDVKNAYKRKEISQEEAVNLVRNL